MPLFTFTIVYENGTEILQEKMTIEATDIEHAHLLVLHFVTRSTRLIRNIIGPLPVNP